MFKRVDKRRRKQEEEEELGLDEDTREVLGLNDTDSDESDSDSDDSDSDGEGAEEGADPEGDEEAEEDEADEDSSDEDEGEEPPISVEEALRDPVYVVSIEPDVKACIACPGKLLKNAEILKLHRASKAHERRWRQFKEFAKSSNAAPDSNAWDVLKQRAEQKPKLSLTEGSTISKRNKKREEKKAAIAARRAKKREAKIKKAKKAADSEGAKIEGSSPPKKKRKVEESADAATEPPKQPPNPKTGRSPRNDRLERQGKLQAKLTPHEAPGGRGKGNGKKVLAGRGKQAGQDERGKRKKDSASKTDRRKPLQIFD
ncbi:hypothetical protein C8R45DRAFT_330500 [Mycena sanguinolenta]|nr:hypothetical protein C8R45DRAFT_330500 [Mycena sanguinolenta]